MSSASKCGLALVVSVTAFMAVANAFPSRSPSDPHCERWSAGDVLLMDNSSLLSRLVRLLQGYGSDFSHVGLVVVDDSNQVLVVHADPAAGRVVAEPWGVIMARAETSGGAVYRLRQTDRSADSARVASAQAMRWAQEGIPFDADFDLSTSRSLYCTELVWRAYAGSGIELRSAATAVHGYILPSDLVEGGRLEPITSF